MSFFIALFFILIANIISKIDYDNKPVIGIYGNSYPENNDTFINGTYYPLSYVYWLQSAGAEVMAIHYWYPFETIDIILNKINGVLFLGGSRDFIKEELWEKKAMYIIEQSLKIKLPVWGTCQGFQLIGVLMSNSPILRYNFDDVNVLHGLEITEETKSSTMYQFFTEKDFDILQYGNSTIYYHHNGFYPEEFYNDTKLSTYFKVTSISQDKNGLKFINSYEGKNDSIKIFATQFHPEKNPYKRYNYPVEQNIDSLKVSHLLAMSFIEEASKNKNRFDSSNNNEGDREQFDFFNTYTGTPNSNYDNESEIFYFSKKNDY